jgi:hypothetical protein
VDLRRGSISGGLHPTLWVPALEVAKVGNARQLSSYERQKHHRPRRSRIHCVHESSCALRRYKVASRIDEVDRQVVRNAFRCPLRILNFRRLQANRQCVALSAWDEHGQRPRIADDRLERYTSLDSVRSSTD